MEMVAQIKTKKELRIGKIARDSNFALEICVNRGFARHAKRGTVPY